MAAKEADMTFSNITYILSGEKKSKKIYSWYESKPIPCSSILVLMSTGMGVGFVVNG